MMARKITPSRQKFRIAKLFARELQKIYGNDLKAVFVVGSVAANMAKPESDIDLIFVHGVTSSWQAFKNIGKVEELELDFKHKYGQEISPRELNAESFELFGRMNIKPMREFKKPTIAQLLLELSNPVERQLFQYLLQGAVPIFGDRKHLEKFEGKCFIFPKRQSIRARYTYKSEVEKRIQFKHSQKGKRRFLP